MSTALISHKTCLDHVAPYGHPECEERLHVILAALGEPQFDHLCRLEAQKATIEQLELVHSR